MRAYKYNKTIPVYDEYGRPARNTGLQDAALVVPETSGVWPLLANPDLEVEDVSFARALNNDQNMPLALKHFMAKVFNRAVGEKVIYAVPTQEPRGIAFVVRQP